MKSEPEDIFPFDIFREQTSVPAQLQYRLADWPGLVFFKISVPNTVVNTGELRVSVSLVRYP